jgi:CheY-like chemotaxis protein
LAPALGPRVKPADATRVAPGSAASQATTANTTKGGPKGSLIYVENDPTLLAVTARLIEFGGWRVHACQSAAQALDLLKAETACNALLTDYRLVDQPEAAPAGTLVDGAQLVRAARALPTHATLPALILTGDAAVREVQGLARVRVLHKPIKSMELLAALDEMA